MLLSGAMYTLLDRLNFLVYSYTSRRWARVDETRSPYSVPSKRFLSLVIALLGDSVVVSGCFDHGMGNQGGLGTNP